MNPTHDLLLAMSEELRLRRELAEHCTRPEWIPEERYCEIDRAMARTQRAALDAGCKPQLTNATI